MSTYDYYWFSLRGFANEGVYVKIRIGHDGDQRLLDHLRARVEADSEAVLTKLDHAVPSAIPIFGERGEGLFDPCQFNAEGHPAHYDRDGNFTGYRSE